jgi:hypothetical protein
MHAKPVGVRDPFERRTEIAHHVLFLIHLLSIR